MPMSVLSRKVGVVLQNAENQIIQDKVEDEIAFGCENLAKSPEDTAAAIDNACRALKLDKTWSTKTLSGGQKQRLSIARAIAKKPEIFIFDDSFSALDYKTDVVLRRELKKATKDATTLIVAQRISTILHADKIIVLDLGKIVGMGTHQELLKSCDVYRQIAMSQLSEEELANE